MNTGRYVILGGLAAFIVLIFVLTTNNHTTIEEIRADMTGVIEQENLEEKTAAKLKESYGISSGDTEGFLIFGSAKESELGEVLVIKAHNREQLEEFRQAAERHLAKLREAYADGNDVQKKQLKTAVIQERGHFLLLVIGDRVSSIEKAFTRSVR